jgi:hypothetical protein
MSSVQNQIQSQIPPEIAEVIRKSRRYGPEFVTPYERQLLTRYFERYLASTPSEAPVADLSQCADELCRRCEFCDVSFVIDFSALKMCSNRRLLTRGTYPECIRGVKVSECTSFDSVWSLTEFIIKLSRQLSGEPVKVRPSKLTRSGVEFIIYSASLRINHVKQFITDDYEKIRIEDYIPRRFSASLLTYLTLYGYYSPPLT